MIRMYDGLHYARKYIIICSKHVTVLLTFGYNKKYVYDSTTLQRTPSADE